MNKVEFLGVTKVPFAERYDNFIGGKWVAPIVRQVFRQRLAGDRPDGLRDRALRRAGHRGRARRRARRQGRLGPHRVAERAAILNRIADRMEENLELPRAGRDLGQRQADPRDHAPPTCRCRSTISAISPACIRAQEGSIGEIDHDTVAYHFHEPLGVVGQIIPWNFPMLMAVLEARAGARRRQLRRAQAGRADAGLDPGLGRDSSAISCRPACSTSSTASAWRPASRSRPARASPRSPSPARPRPAG